MKLLITGGSGFLGAHFVNLARKKGHEIHVIDTCIQTRKNILIDPNVSYHEIDIRDKEKLLQVFQLIKPDIVHHFAAIANVAPSLTDPAKYYDVNITGTLNLLDCMRATNCKKIVFMSTAAVYEVTTEPIDETYPLFYGNPYAHSKLVIEQVLKDYHRAYNIDSISFRPFCATGVDEKMEVGCYHEPETQLIPNVIKAFVGKQDVFWVNGNDHNTPDGTAIRDYVHANDIAEAHLLAIEKLQNPICEIYNLGMNKGYSIMEIIKLAEEIIGQKLNYKTREKREGDPSKLIGNSEKAFRELGWKPKRTMEDIIISDYNFFKSI